MLDVNEYVIDGVKCAVKDTEPNGGAEAVVFVHGNPGPMDDWDDLLPEVAKLTRAIAMDMPGFGRSDRPRRFDHSVEGYARYLRRHVGTSPQVLA